MMSPELTEKLVDQFPLLFKDTQQIFCNDGWYYLLRFLCDGIMNDVYRAQTSVNYWKEVAKEDHDSLDKKKDAEKELKKAKARLQKSLRELPTVAQIKEKFGGLRFYINGGTKKHHERIGMIEELSFFVCEECGKMSGTRLYAHHWHSTLCPEHARERYGDKIVDELANKTT